MALQMPEHPYGREVKAYLGSRVAVPPPWFSLGKQSGAGYRDQQKAGVLRYPRFKHVQLPGDPDNIDWDDNVQRDTVRLCEGSDYRRCLLGMELQDTNVIIGRDLEPQCGLMVRLSEEGRKRRKVKTPHGPTSHHWASKNRHEPAGKTAAEHGVGEIVRVNGNWTCDVQWAADGSQGRGYAVGGQGGRNSRAFHLQLVEPVISRRPRCVANEAIKNMCRAEIRHRPASGRGKGAPSMWSKGSCKLIR